MALCSPVRRPSSGFQPAAREDLSVRNPADIENIEAMRRRQGIDDVELREEVRALTVGDVVKLTFLYAGRESAGETLLVRITRKRGTTFRGKVLNRPVSGALGNLRVGVVVAFAADHIHSVLKGRAAPEPKGSGNRSTVAARDRR
jgi:hypothetical protein